MVWFFVCKSAINKNINISHLTKNYFKGHFSGHYGSNDTGLEFVSCREAEKQGGQTHRF